MVLRHPQSGEGAFAFVHRAPEGSVSEVGLHQMRFGAGLHPSSAKDYRHQLYLALAEAVQYQLEEAE